MQAKRSNAQPLFECQHRLIQRHLLISRRSGFPVHQHQLGIFPKIADRRVLPESFAKGKWKAAVDLEIAGHHRTELPNPQQGLVHPIAVVGLQVIQPPLRHGQQILCPGQCRDGCAAAVVAVALIHLGDRRRRVARHDRIMVAQRCVRIVAIDLQARQADQLSPLDRILRISRK